MDMPLDGAVAGDDAGAPGRALALQRAAFARDGVPGLAERIARLDTLSRAIGRASEEIADAVSADFGNRARPETMLAEVAPLLDAVRHARRHLGRWMAPEPRRVGLNFRPGRAWVEHVPLGVVGIVAPWNYPLFLTAGPLIDALAAGNRATIKPSEITPRFAALFARLMRENFDPEQVSVVTGGADVARAFCAERWDHLLYTGSTETGRLVAEAAARNLVSVTLELGGKSPAIVAPDYDLAGAARSIAVGKFFNAGQTCIAPDYVLIERARAARFADAVLDAARRMYPSVGGNPDLTSVVSERHHARLAALVDEAERGGARVLRLGGATDGRRMPPTVVLGAPADGALLREEIFGPVLPVVGTDGVADAIRYVTERPRPLALYAYTREAATERLILDRTISGGVTINGTMLHCAQPDLPFGGIGPSGIGAYHGRDGFRRLSHARGHYKPGRVSGFEMLRPPYGRNMRMALRWMVRT